MIDREKMIEEMACKIERIFIEESRKEENKMYPWQELPVFHSICLRIATSILPDGDVVLTKEEYERLASYISEERAREIFHEETEKLKEKIRRETAREIIKDLIGHRFAYYEVDEKYGTYRLLSDYVVDKEDVKFLEDKYNVEV